MKNINILAIETSCDETAMAIITNGVIIKSHIINSQAEKFTEIGGVVPEMASRMHEENIFKVFTDTLEKASMTMDDIDAIAVTYGPGLVGALLIGVNFANSLSLLYNKKIIAVNHMQGHIHAIGLENQIVYPMLSLIVSGGHTDIVLAHSPTKFELIGQTLDDAVGESFDKVARLIGLGYPGGPKVEQAAKLGQPTYNLPTPKDDSSLDFSFSGLKSAAFNTINQDNMKNIKVNKEDFAASFQKVVVDILVKKLKMASRQYEVNTISVVGGVSANQTLKKEILKEFPDCLIPSKILCTDNAAMIGAAAYHQFSENSFVEGYANAVPTITVEDNWIN